MMVSEDWDPEGAVLPPGGEVPFEPRPFRNERKKPGALGEHVCGTQEDFAEGCKYEPLVAPVVYGSLGLPNCCNPAVVARGGGAAGGRAVVAFTFGPNTCPTAFQVSYGVDYTTGDLGLGEEWFQFPPDAHGAYALTFTASGGAFKTIEGFPPPCGSGGGFTIVFIIADGPGGTNFANFFATGLLLRMFLSSGPPTGQFITFRIDPF